MPTLKGKSKTKAKSATKAKSKPKAKAKVAVKTKAKAKAASKIKSKAKVKTKLKTKAKPAAKKKTATKANAKPTSKTKKTATKLHKKKQAQSITKTAKTKTTPKSGLQLTDAQKEALLDTIKKIVTLRKHTFYGLRSLDAIDHILDPYNQKYTNTPKKFDAIVDFGLEEHDKYVSDSGLIAFKDNGKDSVALYKLLASLGKGKTKFEEAEQEVNTIYEEALKEKP